MAKENGKSENRRRKYIPGMTLESDENQMVALATNLVRQRLIEGTASAQEVTHYLKLGSQRSRMEQEKLRLETELVKAKTDLIHSQQRSEEMFEKAIKAMKRYQGEDDIDDDEDDYIGDEDE